MKIFTQNGIENIEVGNIVFFNDSGATEIGEVIGFVGGSGLKIENVEDFEDDETVIEVIDGSQIFEVSE